MKTLLTITTIGLLSLSLTSHSSELRLGGGKNCGVAKGDGIWEQKDMFYEKQDCDHALEIKLVDSTPVSWLDWSAGFSYRKSTAIKNGVWLNDPCYSTHTYSGGSSEIGLMPLHEGSGGQCDYRFKTKLVQDEAYVFTLALNPTWRINKDWSLSAGYGVSYFYGITEIDWRAHPWWVCNHKCGTDKYRQIGHSEYMDVTGKYKNFYLTYYIDKDVHGGESHDSGQYGLLAGYAIKF